MNFCEASLNQSDSISILLNRSTTLKTSAFGMMVDIESRGQLSLALKIQPNGLKLCPGRVERKLFQSERMETLCFFPFRLCNCSRDAYDYVDCRKLTALKKKRGLCSRTDSRGFLAASIPSVDARCATRLYTRHLLGRPSSGTRPKRLLDGSSTRRLCPVPSLG